MSVIRKLPQLEAEKIWWLRIQITVRRFAKMIDRIPRHNDEAFDFWTQEVKQMYTEIQRSNCPASGDDVYTSLTRSMINMTMVYEAQRQDDWAKVDVFYGRALEDWHNSLIQLARLGIMFEPSS
jgi:hypothetical protein